MPHLKSSKHGKAAAAALTLLLLGLLLAACGSSSTNSTKSATASASATTSGSSINGSGGSGGASSNGGGSTAPAPGGSGAPTPGGKRAAFGARFSKVRECLAKSGITLPKRSRGQRPSGGFLGNRAPQLPKGVSRTQYEAALHKCGGRPAAGRLKGFAARPQAKEALDRFAACMRERGVNLPTPNTSGKGPIFNTSGLNVSGNKFKAAESKCAAELRDAFGAGRAGAPSGAAPPAGG